MPKRVAENQAYQFLTTAPYLEARRFLWKHVRAQYPRFLYKFRHIDPGSPASISHLRDIVINNRLWLSGPRDFNDPFDMTALLTFQGTKTEKRKRFQKLVSTQGGGMPRAARRSRYRELVGRSNQVTASEISAIQEKNLSECGVCSFAGDPRSIVMWSHYGSNHTGVCFQFELAADPTVFLGAISVNYTATYPVLNWMNESPNAYRDVLLSKYEAWQYEGERRIIRPTEARTYHPFSPTALVGVILGCRTTAATRNLVESLIAERVKKGQRAFRVFEARKHDTKYALRIVGTKTT